MSSLRERLEAKARAIATIQVAVEDVTAAQQTLDAARLEYVAGLVSDPPIDDPELKAAVEAAEAVVDGMYVDVVLQAMPPRDYEALVDAHTDADGTLDRDVWLPQVVAASAVDEDLRDEAWWRDQLTSSRWSAGECSVLLATITRLNDPTVRSAAIPKG